MAAAGDDRERFSALRAAFGRLYPQLDPGDPAAATTLGYLLRTLKCRILGNRVLAEARKTRTGVAWAVRRV